MPKVVIFAGHDHDTWEKLGAKGVRTDLEKDGVYEEYDTNILIANGTVERLRKVKGLTVLFPQENGRKMSLKERVDYANRNEVDLLVDIHSNASASRTATGAAAFYWYTSTAGKKLATLYAALIKKHAFSAWQGGSYASNPNDGWSEFYMLKHSNMPAILTENFFFTTRSELEKYLLNPVNQKKLMDIHADMVTQYFYGTSIAKPAAPKPAEKPVVKPAAPKPPTPPTQKPKEEEDMLKQAIVIGSLNDYAAAEILSVREGIPIYPRNSIKTEVAKELIVVGGNVKGLKADKITNLSGDDRFETADNVEAYLKK